jgi:hypothetical protein
MTTVTINRVTKIQAPRGAAWAAWAALTLWRAVARWTAPRAVPSPIADAAQVRSLARLYLNSDPGFAADLLAAADRHESTHHAR